MNLFRLRACVIVLLIAIAFGCEKDEPTSPFLTNNSIRPSDFLMDLKYTTLTIEVASMAGYEPTTAALNRLVAFLDTRLNKKGGITVNQRIIPASGKSKLDITNIRDLEKTNRTTVASGSNLTMWVVFLDAEYTDSDNTKKILGISYGATSLAVFPKSIDAYITRDMPSRYALETFVLTHETGHILGLVNNGTQMAVAHQDTEHGAHCSNTNCLMYWEAQNNVKLGDLLGEDELPILDENCLLDLRAAGGK